MAGRPKSNINWQQLDQLLVAGCSGAEVAAYIGINKATIYDRCEQEYGIPFSEYSQQKKAKGRSLLRSQQFAKALGTSDQGDNTLLIWLGKQRLEQNDRQQIEHTVISKESEIVQE